MTTPDYLVAANQLQKGEACSIANFGLDQSSFQEWVKLDQSTKLVKTKDHKTDIDNAKRLIAKYAREEQLVWEQNLKDKGLWTQAQEERKQKMSNKNDFDLYAKLESNFMLPIESAEHNLYIRADNAVSMSMDDGISLLQKVQNVGNSASQQNDYMDIRQTVEMMPQDEVRSEHDLGFMTEVDAEFKGNMGKESNITHEVISTRQSEGDVNTSAPQIRSSLLEVENAEFKQIIKEIISKEQNDQL